jgi:hypothetical protein
MKMNKCVILLYDVLKFSEILQMNWDIDKDQLKAGNRGEFGEWRCTLGSGGFDPGFDRQTQPTCKNGKWVGNSKTALHTKH